MEIPNGDGVMSNMPRITVHELSRLMFSKHMLLNFLRSKVSEYSNFWIPSVLRNGSADRIGLTVSNSRGTPPQFFG